MSHRYAAPAPAPGSRSADSDPDSQGADTFTYDTEDDSSMVSYSTSRLFRLTTHSHSHSHSHAFAPPQLTDHDHDHDHDQNTSLPPLPKTPPSSAASSTTSDAQSHPHFPVDSLELAPISSSSNSHPQPQSQSQSHSQPPRQPVPTPSSFFSPDDSLLATRRRTATLPVPDVRATVEAVVRPDIAFPPTDATLANLGLVHPHGGSDDEEDGDELDDPPLGSRIMDSNSRPASPAVVPSLPGHACLSHDGGSMANSRHGAHLCEACEAADLGMVMDQSRESLTASGHLLTSSHMLDPNTSSIILNASLLPGLRCPASPIRRSTFPPADTSTMADSSHLTLPPPATASSPPDPSSLASSATLDTSVSMPSTSSDDPDATQSSILVDHPADSTHMFTPPSAVISLDHARFSSSSSSSSSSSTTTGSGSSSASTSSSGSSRRGRGRSHGSAGESNLLIDQVDCAPSVPAGHLLGPLMEAGDAGGTDRRPYTPASSMHMDMGHAQEEVRDLLGESVYEVEVDRDARTPCSSMADLGAARKVAAETDVRLGGIVHSPSAETLVGDDVHEGRDAVEYHDGLDKRRAAHVRPLRRVCGLTRRQAWMAVGVVLVPLLAGAVHMWMQVGHVGSVEEAVAGAQVQAPPALSQLVDPISDPIALDPELEPAQSKLDLDLIPDTHHAPFADAPADPLPDSPDTTNPAAAIPADPPLDIAPPTAPPPPPLPPTPIVPPNDLARFSSVLASLAALTAWTQQYAIAAQEYTDALTTHACWARMHADATCRAALNADAYARHVESICASVDELGASVGLIVRGFEAGGSAKEMVEAWPVVARQASEAVRAFKCGLHAHPGVEERVEDLFSAEAGEAADREVRMRCFECSALRFRAVSYGLGKDGGTLCEQLQKIGFGDEQVGGEEGPMVVNEQELEAWVRERVGRLRAV